MQRGPGSVHALASGNGLCPFVMRRSSSDEQASSLPSPLAAAPSLRDQPIGPEGCSSISTDVIMNQQRVGCFRELTLFSSIIKFEGLEGNLLTWDDAPSRAEGKSGSRRIGVHLSVPQSTVPRRKLASVAM